MKITVRGPHGLELPALRARVEERLAHYETRYPNLRLREQYHWLDERHARGSYRGGHGTVALGPDEVVVELELPFFARPFRGRIEQFVRDEIEAVTRPA
jgi:hypothetical protein